MKFKWDIFDVITSSSSLYINVKSFLKTPIIVKTTFLLQKVLVFMLIHQNELIYVCALASNHVTSIFQIFKPAHFIVHTLHTVARCIDLPEFRYCMQNIPLCLFFFLPCNYISSSSKHCVKKMHGKDVEEKLSNCLKT